MLSAHFNLREFLRSDAALRHGIDMTPPTEVIHALRDLCRHVLEPLRDFVRAPLVITSGYRPLALNTLVGGSPGSQHIRGEAADIECPELSPRELCQAVLDAKLPIDQLVLEFPPHGWCHVSYSNRRQRGDVLTIRRGHAPQRGLHG